MAKITYSEKLTDPRWQKKRLEIMGRDNFRCQSCWSKKNTLNVHHKKYTAKNIWDEPSENLTTICKNCHDIYHRIKKEYNAFGEFQLNVIDLYCGTDELNYFVIYHRYLYFIKSNIEEPEKLEIHLCIEAPAIDKLIAFLIKFNTWH